MGQITSVSIINDDLRPDYTVFPSGISISGHIKKYATYKEMREDRNPPKYGWVEDASGDDTVTTGSALYYNKVGNVWVKIYETEMIDNFDDLLTKVFWSEIIGKPESAPTDIDLTVENSHVHNNSLVLTALGETNEHILTYKGNVVGWQQDVIDEIKSNISIVKNDISTLSIRIGNNETIITTLNAFKDAQGVHNEYVDTRLTSLETTQSQMGVDITNLQEADININQNITTLQNQYTVVNNKATENSNKILNLASENAAIKSSITVVDERVTALENTTQELTVSVQDLVIWKRDLVDNHKIGTFALRIANLESWRISIDGYGLESISQNVSVLLTDVADLKDRVAVLKSRADALQLKVDGHNSRITDLENVTEAHTSSLTNITASITSINTTLAGKANISITTELREDVDSLLAWKITVDEQLEKGMEANIIARLNTAESDITFLKNRVSAVEEKNEWYDDKLAEHDTSITSITQSHNALSVTVENHITTNATEHEAIDGRLDILESDVATLKANDVAMDQQIMQHTSKISTHDTRITSLEGRIDNLEQQGRDYGVDIEGLKQQVQSNTESISVLNEEVLGAKALATEIDGMI